MEDFGGGELPDFEDVRVEGRKTKEERKKLIGDELCPSGEEVEAFYEGRVIGNPTIYRRLEKPRNFYIFLFGSV